MRAWIHVVIASFVGGLSLSLYQEEFFSQFLISTAYSGIGQALLLLVMHVIARCYRATVAVELWQLRKLFSIQKLYFPFGSFFYFVE